MRPFFRLFLKPSPQTLLQEMLAEYERRLVLAEAEANYSKKLAEHYRECVQMMRARLPTPMSGMDVRSS